MTFSLRRKLRTIRRAARLRAAVKTTSALAVLLTVLTSAYGQSFLTPKFVPSRSEPARVTPAQYSVPVATPQPDILPAQGAMRGGPGEDRPDSYVRVDLPGP